MLKAMKLTTAAILVAGSCGLAMAQGGGAGGANSDANAGKPDRPANADTINNAKKPATPGAASTGAAMKQKNTNMGAPNAGPNETGTAKDPAGSGTNRQIK